MQVEVVTMYVAWIHIRIRTRYRIWTFQIHIHIRIQDTIQKPMLHLRCMSTDTCMGRYKHHFTVPVQHRFLCTMAINLCLASVVHGLMGVISNDCRATWVDCPGQVVFLISLGIRAKVRSLCFSRFLYWLQQFRWISVILNRSVEVKLCWFRYWFWAICEPWSKGCTYDKTLQGRHLWLHSLVSIDWRNNDREGILYWISASQDSLTHVVRVL